MALVDDGQEVFGQVVEQAVGTRSRLTAVEVARIVLDARAVAHLANHLQVVGHTLIQALCLNGAVFAVEHVDLCAQVHVNLSQGARHALFAGDEDIGGVDVETLHALARQHRQWVEKLHAFYLIAPEDDAQHGVGVGNHHVYGVAFHPEGAHRQLILVAAVQGVDEATQELVAAYAVAHFKAHDISLDVLGVAHAIKARHTRHHYHVSSSREQRSDGGKAQAVNLLVDGKVFLNVFVARGQVGLGLVVVVVGHKVLHRVLGEKRLKLGIELRSEGLVVRQD